MPSVTIPSMDHHDPRPRGARVHTPDDVDGMFAKLLRTTRLRFGFCVVVSLVFGTLAVLLLLDGARVDGEAAADLAVLGGFTLGTVYEGVRLRRIGRLRDETRATFERAFADRRAARRPNLEAGTAPPPAPEDTVD
ncbi:MAG: hypothetical protein H6825_02655 [Planctomycetes bacterium]|nr:hypothetical protein [Planctomycetota bacterium]